jgi:hypothetical protein
MAVKTWIPANPIGLPATADTAFVWAWIEEFWQAMLDFTRARGAGQDVLAEYEQWHASKGYWPNETPYGTLNAH